jgi:hypothetical protein
MPFRGHHPARGNAVRPDPEHVNSRKASS